MLIMRERRQRRPRDQGGVTKLNLSRERHRKAEIIRFPRKRDEHEDCPNAKIGQECGREAMALADGPPLRRVPPGIH